MYVLDTDHLGEYQKGTSPAAQRLIQRLDAATEPVATTMITVEEIMRGWMAAIRRENDPRKQESIALANDATVLTCTARDLARTSSLTRRVTNNPG